MSVSLYWKPTDPGLGVCWGGGSSLHAAMSAAFGGFPMTLTRDHIKTLEGIAACGYADVRDLISAVYENGSVEVRAEW